MDLLAFSQPNPPLESQADAPTSQEPNLSPQPQKVEPSPADDDNMDNRTVDELMDDISDLDTEMTNIRFNKSLNKDQILEKINDLMEQRNTLYDKLQERRNAEFHSFVDSLHLQDISIVPFYPVQRKCKLNINNPLTNEILKAPTIETQKKWGKGLFKKQTNENDGGSNATHQDGQGTIDEELVARLTQQHRDFCAGIRAKLNNDLERIEKKKYLSPDETAAKLRIKAELVELDRFSGAKK